MYLPATRRILMAAFIVGALAPADALAQTGRIGPACGSKAASVVPGSSVRVLTFNTALYSPIFLCGGVDPFCHLGNDLGKVTRERAKSIAGLLESGRFDIISLNEVWDEDDGKDILHDALCPVYPNYVSYIDVAGGGFEEDSGLMLFSKFPFESLPETYFKSEDSHTSGGDDYDHIAYVKFDDCTDDDCLAAKGAILVRFKHPSSGRIINVVGTHLQADYDDDHHEDIRWKQLRQIYGQCSTGIPTTHPNLIHKTLGPSLASGESLCSWSNDQWIFMMGDLNIRGNNAVGEALFPASGGANQGPGEWWWKFGSEAAGDKFALYDAWAETTSEVDPGLSHTDGERLDYILASRRTKALPGVASDMCVQHIWMPPEFEALSDHRPVAADLNLTAPQCNPRLAIEPAPVEMGIGLATSKQAKKLKGIIQYAGSMQWWRLSEGGTYSIALDPAAVNQGLSFEIYQANNLSQPLAGTYKLETDTLAACQAVGVSGAFGETCEATQASKFVLPKGPLYVRVFNTNRAWNGQYWIAFHRYNCRTKDEACELLPNAPVSFVFPPAGTPLNAEDAAWFRIQIREQADSGKHQKLSFFALNAGASAWNQPKLLFLDSDGKASISKVGGEALSSPAAFVEQGMPGVAVDGFTAANEIIHLRVGRANVNTALSLNVGWRTNLMLLGGSEIGPKAAKLVCKDETNPEFGEDEIELKINIDGTGWVARGSASFDCNDQALARNWDSKLGVIRFLDSVQFRTVETDDNPDDVAPVDTETAKPLTTQFLEPEPHKIWWKWSGGEYELHYYTSKWRMK